MSMYTKVKDRSQVSYWTKLQFGFRGHMIPGIILCFSIGTLLILMARLLPDVSTMLLAILAGVFFRNVIGVARTFETGIIYASKTLLRAGIILLGLQLALGDILSLGWGVAVMVIAIVTAGMLSTYYLGRALKLSRAQSLLIASGFSICGAAAVAAASDVTEAKEEETLTSIALVVIFGTLMIPLFPFLVGALDIDARTAGLWTGGAVHEVAQVVAIGGILGGTALSIAVLVKLARVLMLAPVMLVLSWTARKRHNSESRSKRPPLIPLFVVSFIIAVILRSLEIVPTGILEVGHFLQSFLLTSAMFGLGCGVKASYFKSIGIKPFILAFVSTVVVCSVALFGALLSA